MEAVKRWKVDTGYDYEVRGEITTMRLDALIEHDVQVSGRACRPRARTSTARMHFQCRVCEALRHELA